MAGDGKPEMLSSPTIKGCECIVWHGSR